MTIFRTYAFAAVSVLLSLLPRIASAQGLGGMQQPATVQVLRSDMAGVTIKVSGLNTQITAGKTGAVIVHNTWKWSRRADSALTGLISFNVGVPSDATAFTATAEPVWKPGAGQLPAGLDIVRRLQTAPLVRAGRPYVMRGLQIVSLDILPVLVSGNSVRTATEITVRLNWRRPAASAASLADTRGPYREIPSVEAMMKDYVINFDGARSWRSYGKAPVNKRTAGVLATQPGMGQAIVLLNGSTAIQRISGRAIGATGAPGLLGSPISGLKLTANTADVPFRVVDLNNDGLFDAADTLVYLGLRNPSEEAGLFYSEVTDTNACILRWNTSGNTRPAITDKDGAVPASDTLRWYDSTLHFEEDLVYLAGLTEPQPLGDVRTIHVPERTLNERYYWFKLQYNTLYRDLKTMPFRCSPYYGSGDSVTLSVRIAGVGMIGRDSITHRVQMILNESTIVDTLRLSEVGDTLVTYRVSVNNFLNGKNTLDFVLVPPPGVSPGDYKAQDIIYVDYLQLKGRWVPASFGADAALRLGPGQQGPVSVAIEGLRQPAQAAVSQDYRIFPIRNEPGFTYRLTSRQFDPSERYKRGFYVQNADSVIADTGPYEPGFLFLEINPATGDVLRKGFFNIYPDPVANGAWAGAADFLRKCADGNIVVGGVSIGGGAQQLSPELRDQIRALGSKVADRNDWFVSSWAFAAVKGAPSAMSERFQPYDGNRSGLTLTAFIPATNGTSYRAVATLQGAPGQEFLLGGYQEPKSRYHPADSLLSTDNRADMIIITHPAFAQEAYRLAAHRTQHNKLTVRVVDVNTIYDEFNAGVKSPNAIRAFLQYSYNNWKTPGAAFVLLMGNASWNPQGRLPSSTLLPDYVPSLFNPVSDYMYTVDEGGDVGSPRQFIGRLSVLTSGDAHAIVDKLIEYDKTPPASWNKRFVFMVGGYNESEMQLLARADYKAIFRDVTSQQFGGDTTLILRTDFTSHEADGPRAREELTKGEMWVSFTGHGSTSVVDLDYGFPENIDNGNKYFVMSTWSCQTGAFAEPSVTVRNESFVNYPGRGAVAATGSTSFSPVDVDEAVKDGLYTDMTRNHIRNIGFLITAAKTRMYKYYLQLDDSVRARNSLLTYLLIGDPAMDLAVRNTPELGWGNVAMLNQMNTPPTTQDTTLVVHARLGNYGLPISPAGPDSQVVAVAVIINPDRTEFRDTVRLIGLLNYADLEFRLPLQRKPGAYTVRLEADPAFSITTETYRDDNNQSYTLLIQGNRPLPIEPLLYGRVASYDTVSIRLLNPSGGPGASIELDTTSSFSSPARFTNASAGRTTNAELTTTWTFTIPSQLRQSRTFWWRAVSTAGDTAVANLFPLVGSFTVQASGNGDFYIGGVQQMNQAARFDLVNTPQGVGPGEHRAELAVTSIGQTRLPNGELVQQKKISMRIDGREYRIAEAEGLNLIVLPPDNPVPYANQTFTVYRTGELERFRDFVRDSVPVGYKVLLGASGTCFFEMHRHPDSVSFKDAFKSIGSALIDVVNDNDSYVLFGGKGMPASQVKEKRINADSLLARGQVPPFELTLTDSMTAVSQAGQLQLPAVGPAATWKRGVLDYSGNAPLLLTVWGLRRDGVRDSLLTASVSSVLDLSGVNAAVYPYVEILARFQNDTTQRLRALAVEFDPSPELALVPSTLRLEQDSVLQGDPGKLSATVLNLTLHYPATNVPVRLAYAQEGNTNLIDSATIARINPDDSARVTFTIPTDIFTGVRTMSVQCNPADNPSELYKQNNQLLRQIRVGPDNQQPGVTIFADGQRLMNNDYVPPQPTFEVRLFDNSHLKLVDTISIRMILDNQIVVASSPGARYRAVTGGGVNNEQRAVLTYQPEARLKQGLHEMRVLSRDATGNADTTEIITFFVEYGLKLTNVVNLPNPFARNTTFTFMVGGGQQPAKGEVAIFTVSGRKIRTIPITASDLHIGFNKVDWDGLDADGDPLANGTYLYRVTVYSADQKSEVIEKLVKMR